MRLGRGSDEKDQLGSWARAVTPEPPVNAEKAKCYRRMDGWADGRTDRRTAGCRVARTRLKKYERVSLLGSVYFKVCKQYVCPLTVNIAW